MQSDKPKEAGIRSFVRLAPYVKPHTKKVVGGIIFLILIDIAQVLALVALRNAVNAIKDPQITLGFVTLIVGFYMGLGAFTALGRYFWRRWMVGTGIRVITDLREDLLDHLQTLSFSFYDRRQVGDLMAHSTEDIENIRRAISFGPIILIDFIFQGLATVVAMVLLEFPATAILTLYCLIPLVIIGLMAAKFSPMLRKRWRAVREGFSSMTARVTENLSGIRVVKAYVQEKGETEVFKGVSRDYVKRNVNLFKIWGFMFPLIMFLSSVSLFIILLVGGRYVILGDLSIGSFVAFQGLIAILIWPMMAIGWLMNLVQSGVASVARLNRLFETKPEIADTEDTLPLEEIEGRIRFKGLTFYYPDMTHPALENIDLELFPGKILGIIGTIGSGKSTLVSLIPRLYEAPEGAITVDGHYINRIPLKVLRESVGMVPQDTFLFSQTVAENIAFGVKREVSGEEIQWAAKVAGIHDEILNFPKGYETILGERGVTVSGGQKQRLTIARAVLTDARILILDDALSAVDADTEIEILTSLKELLRERAVIIVSARPRSLAFADEILVMDEGRIAERGTHSELLKKDGLYALFAKLQGIT